MTSITLEEARSQRFPASFDGLPFIMSSSRRFGSNETITDFVVGRGSRRRHIAPGEKGWSVAGHIIDARLAGAVEAMDRALTLSNSTGRVGQLVHPFDGVVQVVPSDWSFDYQGSALDFCPFSATFVSAELPTVEESAGRVPQNADETVITLAELARVMADEPDPLAQLAALRPLLQLPDTLQGADYTQAAALRLGQRADIETDRVPRIIQKLGEAARAADAGEYTTGARDRLRVEIMQEAARSDSLALLNMRESWSLYLGNQGVQAFGRIVQQPQGLLVNLPGDYDRLAELNRRAIETLRIDENGARL